MNKLVPFTKFSKKAKQIPSVSGSSVVVNSKGIPLGFVFSRDSFISLCTVIDNEFEKRVKDQRKAFNNPAGKLIDLIEERLPLNPAFVKDLKTSIFETRKSGWISLNEIANSLNV